MNGVEATLEICSLIKQHHLPSVPIIGCSAFEARDDIERCKNAGMIGSLLLLYSLHFSLLEKTYQYQYA